jgi:hypothetical protein
MKKKLEADLISIAHRILKLKNKSELIQLHEETQRLYEKLSILRFVEEHFSDVKPTIGKAEIEDRLEAAFEAIDHNVVEELPLETVENTVEVAPEVVLEVVPETTPEVVEEELEEEIIESTPEVVEEETEEEVVETVPELVEETIVEEVVEEVVEESIASSEEKADLEPHFELFKEEIVFETPEPKKEIKQISFEDLLGGTLSDPIFERVQKMEKVEVNGTANYLEPEVFTKEEEPSVVEPEVVLEEEESPFEPKPIAVNDASKRIITFGLNDKIAFEKHLFGGSGEDLNRVISQLSTYDTLQEAQDFIEDMVKPDYNDWEGKDDYVQRFMEIVEKKFS